MVSVALGGAAVSGLENQKKDQDRTVVEMQAAAADKVPPVPLPLGWTGGCFAGGGVGVCGQETHTLTLSYGEDAGVGQARSSCCRRRVRVHACSPSQFTNDYKLTHTYQLRASAVCDAFVGDRRRAGQ